MDIFVDGVGLARAREVGVIGVAIYKVYCVVLGDCDLWGKCLLLSYCLGKFAVPCKLTSKNSRVLSSHT